MKKNRTPTLAAGLAAAVLATVAYAQTGTTQDALAEEIPNYTRPDEEIAFAGQPPEPVFAKLKEAGFQTILSLRSPDEIDFDEKQAVEAQGMTYVNIPISTGTITDEKVAAFSKVVKDSGKPLLIHCGASSRVGGMWYIYRALFDKAPEEQSLDEALARGLASPALEEVVKDYVRNRKGQDQP